ncbi:MAG: hypothetical protein JJE30_12490 [Desulfuromonadales bacterium]|nr:hypothetical protein [Desulfuromonadales bacterium]
MKKQLVTIATVVTVGLIAGCGGSGSGSSSSPATSTTVSGKVADGYLNKAEVFLDKNGTYQWDGVEPKATTDANGFFSMTVSSTDAARYPVVARAIAGTTFDMDAPAAAVASGYVMSAPAGASGFISPMSSLIREKMTANPTMSMTDAMTQLRNQMNLPAGIDMMADYMAGSQSGTNAAQYQAMHDNARKMAALMAGQSGQVMNNGSGVNVNRYRSMMGTINSNMSAITVNTMGSTFMTGMMTQMQTQLGAMPMGGGFMNYSGMFRNMTSSRYFWSGAGGTATPTTPMSGGMMR